MPTRRHGKSGANYCGCGSSPPQLGVSLCSGCVACFARTTPGYRGLLDPAFGSPVSSAVLILDWFPQQSIAAQGVWRRVSRLADERWLPRLSPVPAPPALLGASVT